jgi:hypothetical protein
MTAPTITAAERDVRDFAREFDTPNVRRMVALCESGRVGWDQAAELARKALAAGLAEVR